MRILLIDDEPAILRSLLRIVGNMGHRMMTAGSVAEARIAMGIRDPMDTGPGKHAGAEFDLVITDYNLGDGTAADIGLTGTPPYIVLSGTSDDVPSEFWTRAFGYLKKPAGIRDLEDMMTSAERITGDLVA